MNNSNQPDDDLPFDMEGAIEFIAVAFARGESYASFADKFLANTDHLMPAPAYGNLRKDPQLRRRLAVALVRALWRQFPDPEHRFSQASLPNPERNAECHCGSGRKYKNCCAEIDAGVPFERMNLLPNLLAAMPKKRWVELVGSRIALDMVGATAHELTRERKDKDACTLLEPWFVTNKYLDARHEMLFDCLLEAYTHLGKPRKKASLLDRACEHGDRAIHSAALQRRVCMHADQGEFAKAWQRFAEAQRADPDSPSLSHVEVTVLFSQGRDAEGRERARFWAKRLQRRGDPNLDDLIGLLEDMAEQGSGAMLGVAATAEPVAGELIEAIETAPPVASVYKLKPQDDSAGPLQASDELDAALLEWDDTFPDFNDDTFLEDLEYHVWASAPNWLSLLQRKPILWQSFEALDSLVQAVLLIPVPGTQSVAIGLLDRAEQILREVIRANGVEGLKLEWGWLQNRAALSLIGERITNDLAAGPTAENVRRMEWLVGTLNPNDNQGYRMMLLHAYLELGRYKEALALSDRYPDDFASMRYDRALAFFALGRIDDADNALRSAMKSYPKLLAWLFKANPKPPRPGEFGILVGGDEEAWNYREQHLALWQRLGALDWAARIKRSRKR